MIGSADRNWSDVDAAAAASIDVSKDVDARLVRHGGTGPADREGHIGGGSDGDGHGRDDGFDRLIVGRLNREAGPLTMPVFSRKAATTAPVRVSPSKPIELLPIEAPIATPNPPEPLPPTPTATPSTSALTLPVIEAVTEIAPVASSLLFLA